MTGRSSALPHDDGPAYNYTHGTGGVPYIVRRWFATQAEADQHSGVPEVVGLTQGVIDFLAQYEITAELVNGDTQIRFRDIDDVQWVAGSGDVLAFRVDGSIIRFNVYTFAQAAAEFSAIV